MTMQRERMTRSPHAESFQGRLSELLPESADIEILKSWLKKLIRDGGLPLTEENTNMTVLTFVGYVEHVEDWFFLAGSESPAPSKISKVMRDSVLESIEKLDGIVRHELENFEDDTLTEIAKIYFSYYKKDRGIKLVSKYEKMTAIHKVSIETLRRPWRKKILDILARQIYQSCRYN